MLTNYHDFIGFIPEKERLPETCKRCRDDGYSTTGVCERCASNQAKNREWLQTHAFVYDTHYRGYHYCDHKDFKRMPLRMADEYPYLYYGMEVEATFDEDGVSVYYEEDEDDYGTVIHDTLQEFSRITHGIAVYEYDSTVPNGVEIIFRPCSYAYLTDPEHVQWLKDGFEYLQSRGALIKQPTCNGMHIHISKKFFERGRQTVTAQSSYEGFDWLFQKFQPEFEKLCGREYTEWCSSKAKRVSEELKSTARNMGATVELEAKLKKGGQVPFDNHRACVNMTSETIETRVFASTVDYKQILANIELVRNIAHAVREENIELPLGEILHTKDNLFLDERIRKVQMECKKSGEPLDLGKVNDNEIKLKI